MLPSGQVKPALPFLVVHAVHSILPVRSLSFPGRLAHSPVVVPWAPLCSFFDNFPDFAFSQLHMSLGCFPSLVWFPCLVLFLQDKSGHSQSGNNTCFTISSHISIPGLPGGCGKESTCQCRRRVRSLIHESGQLSLHPNAPDHSS